MRYKFPKGITIDEVRTAIANANARAGENTKVFIEADRGDHVIFNYIISYEGSWPVPDTGDVALDREYAILRECRGLTFHKNGRILARKFHKFFNIGQKDETQVGAIDWTQPHDILSKMDGSMLVPVYLGDDLDDIAPEALEWHSKMGKTDMTAPVEAWIADHPHYANWAAQTIYAGFTPIFEWVSRKQRIVIDYPVDRLVLLAVRNNKTGEYRSYEQLLSAERSSIEIVRALPGSIKNIEAFIAETRELKGEEGYVIRFHDGHAVKAKADQYLLLHKTKEMLQFEKSVISLIAYDQLDDAMVFIEQDDRKYVEAFQTAYETAVAATAAELASIVAVTKKAVGDDQKAFAAVVTKTVYPAEYQRMIFKIKNGADATAEVRKVIAQFAHPTAGTQSRIDAIRHLFGGLRWDDYRPTGYVGDGD